MGTAIEIPRIVIAATGSGVGKTTATVALIAALRARGMRVAAFKCGPDYLDPSYHRRASGSVSHNLDGWMMGRKAVIATFARAAADADIAVVEGMMGLFDSATPTSDEGSTAEIAKWIAAPVVLVIDAIGIARTVGAYALGFARFDPAVRLAGIICNRVGSRGHLELLRTASSDIPVVGGLPADDSIAFPERHLGLFNADEKILPESRLAKLGDTASEWCDLDKIIAIARSAPPIETASTSISLKVSHAPTRCKIGVALDEAFHFYYEDNLTRLKELGAELVYFAPTRDRALPEVDGLYFGGGYPEVMARDLAANETMRCEVREFARSGGIIYAECGGLMYMTRAIKTLDGVSYPMTGLIATEAVMAPRLQALGYVEVETCAPSIFGREGISMRGHQFRYSNLDPPPAGVEQIYRVRPRWGSEFVEGYRVGNLLASYVHMHWASNPDAAAAFVESCAARRKDRGAWNVS